MRVLGVDPGSRSTGFGVVESRAGSLEAIEYGILPGTGKGPIEQRLATLHREMTDLLARVSPDVAALESPYAGLNPRSLIVLSQARGALLAAVANSGVAVHEYAPAQVKAAVTGYGRAEKEQVARMVRMLLGLGERELGHDASDALAVAICCAHTVGFARVATDAGGGD